MSDHEDEALLRLAQSVADGKPVDWPAELLSGGASLQQVARLRLLESIGAAYGMTREREAAPKPPRPTGPALFRWGHLEIREKIGEGVFGAVYRAWETTLEREVAVKLLHVGSSIATVPPPVHVLQEGRNLAKIRHPGVVAVYGAEENDGSVGIWMELVLGHTLEDILKEQGSFGANEAIMIGIDLCRALGAVHRAGLVHRDVKSRNVMREEGGRIVLMDFGTGAGLGPDGSSPTRAFAGTPVYLAPEILRGESASPRSDLYALGVLLYRLVTRDYPVRGAETLDDLRRAHEQEEINLLRDARPDLPEPFVRAVEKALAVKPGERFASAGQMEKALCAALSIETETGGRPTATPGGSGPGAISRAGAAGGLPSIGPMRSAARRRAGYIAVTAIAVLGLGLAIAKQRFRSETRVLAARRVPIAVADFLNETHEPELDGLASMLITSLEQSRGLAVLTRSRMSDILAQMGKEDADRIDESLGREICRQAGVGALLVPSIRKFDELYTIDLRVLDPHSNEYVFTAREQGQGRQRIPAMIDALSEKARAGLKEKRSEIRATSRPVAEIVTADLDAYQHYHRAERHIDALEMKEARAELEQAVARDSTFGLAYWRSAYVCWWLSDFESAKRQLRQAFARIDRIPEKERFLLRAQGAIADAQGLEAARSILQEMERFYPDDKEMLYDIGDYSSHLSEHATAVQYLERVLAMDPKFVRGLQHLARVYRDMGRPVEMLQYAKRYASIEVNGESSCLLGSAQIATGDFETGIETLLRGKRMAPDRVQELTFALAKSYLIRGQPDRAAAEWRKLIAGPYPPLTQAVAYQERALSRAYQGRYRQAIADLVCATELARQCRDEVTEAMAHVDAALLCMVGRNDPRTAQLEIEKCAAIQDSVTYQGQYFSYWPYWGRVFKLHLLSGHLQEGEELAKQKFAADKWYSPYVATYLHCAKGEVRQAEASSSQILEWGPATENIELLYVLAKCQLDQGMLDGAEKSLRRLQALHGNLNLGAPYYPKSLLLLGEVFEKKGETRLASESYQRLLDLWRDGDADLPDLIEVRGRWKRLNPPPQS